MTQKAFKYRFYPTPEQETLLRRTMGCTRLVYNRALRVDLGITSLVALSTGEKIANPKGFKAKYSKLHRAQKALNRKQKGSNNRHKARLKLARIHQQIGDTRKDFLALLAIR